MTIQQAKNLCSNMKITETEMMNFLQDYGFVSDNAVTLDEVAEEDLKNAWDSDLYDMLRKRNG